MKKYRCSLCGQVVEVNEGESCPICGATFDQLIPLDDKQEENK